MIASPAGDALAVGTPSDAFRSDTRDGQLVTVPKRIEIVPFPAAQVAGLRLGLPFLGNLSDAQESGEILRRLTGQIHFRRIQGGLQRLLAVFGQGTEVRFPLLARHRLRGDPLLGLSELRVLSR